MQVRCKLLELSPTESHQLCFIPPARMGSLVSILWGGMLFNSRKKKKASEDLQNSRTVAAHAFNSSALEAGGSPEFEVSLV